jgi:phage shock protein PspC (stress-responsive transcriptional regulator)
MKKTISISVSNMLFHVEEDACNVLQNYLNTLKSHFAKEEGGDEIYNDIQARAAEILQSKTSTTKQVITSEDVNDLISKLGTPADFGMEENTEAKSNQQQYQQQQFDNNKTKRLYRDPDNKVIGGVCSGIAYYFGFDPLWLRIALFASLIFYGFGFIPYLIMLLVVPKAETTAEKLEMRGEPVNVDTISKMMQDEIKGVGTRVGKVGAEVNQNIRQHSGNFFSRFFDVLGDIIMGIFRILGKIITVFFIILACILFFSLIPLIAAYFSGSNSEFAY